MQLCSDYRNKRVKKFRKTHRKIISAVVKVRATVRRSDHSTMVSSAKAWKACRRSGTLQLADVATETAGKSATRGIAACCPSTGTSPVTGTGRGGRLRSTSIVGSCGAGEDGSDADGCSMVGVGNICNLSAKFGEPSNMSSLVRKIDPTNWRSGSCRAAASLQKYLSPVKAVTMVVTAMEAVPAWLRVDDGVPVAVMTETIVSADELAGQLVVESVCGLDTRESPAPCPLDQSS